MSRNLAIPALVLASLVQSFGPSGVGIADDRSPGKQLTLMGMLQEWMYPDSALNGAQISDAGVSGVRAVKSKAILTTPNPVEDVVGFYCKKLNVDKEGKNLDEKEGERITTDRSVLVHNVSGDSASKLYVLAVNTPQSSTTLVIYRAQDSRVTRIGWLNYHQLGP